MKSSLILFIFFALHISAPWARADVFKKNKVHLTSADPFGLVLVHAECLKNESSNLPTWVRALWKNSRQILPPGMRARSIPFAIPSIGARDIEQAAQSPCVIGIDRNEVISVSATPITLNDRYLTDQLYLPYIGFENHRRIYANPFFKSPASVLVAVVDSGISRTHVEFYGKHFSDAMGNQGYNFVDGNYDVEDDHGHGSHVAGLIAAVSGNRNGIAGIAQNAKILTLKALDENGDGTVGDVADAIRYAADQGAEIINLSLGIDSNPAAVEAAVDYALGLGAFIVAASGNDGTQITVGQFVSPAGLAASRTGMICVGALDSASGLRSDFSNYSTTYVEMAAPGSHGMSHILSTFKEERYASLAGTSMAAPLVAGAIAEVLGIFKSEGINLTPGELERFVLDHSPTNSNLSSTIQSGRELNLEKLGIGALKNFKLPADGGFDE